MARVKDRDDEAKLNFLAKAMSGTKWGLHTKQRVPIEPSLQRLTNALYTSNRALGTFQKQTASRGEEGQQPGAYRK